MQIFMNRLFKILKTLKYQKLMRQNLSLGLFDSKNPDLNHLFL